MFDMVMFTDLNKPPVSDHRNQDLNMVPLAKELVRVDLATPGDL
jgi:hypothetical protein